MELPDADLNKGVVTIVIGAFAYIWHRINGDIKVAKALAQAAFPRLEVIVYMDKQEKIQEAIFTLIRDHAESNSKTFSAIVSSLAVLEERSKNRRRDD